MDDPDRAKLRAISARLQTLQQQKAAEEAASAANRAESSAWSQGAEFVGAVIVGGGIGWWIDRHFGTVAAAWRAAPTANRDLASCCSMI